MSGFSLREVMCVLFVDLNFHAILFVEFLFPAIKWHRLVNYISVLSRVLRLRLNHME